MFETGKSGNVAGRPKGSFGGRIQALAGLDKLLGKNKNQRALIAALEKDLQKDPVRFFKTVIMPLLPRESKLSFDHDGVIQWKSLIGASADQERSEVGDQRSAGEDAGEVPGSDGQEPGQLGNAMG